MNSLEFIEKLIEDYEYSKERFLDNLKRYPDDEVFTRCVKTCEQKIQTLQQIKEELEAWEVVKNKIYYDSSKEYIDLSLIYLGCIKDKNYQKLKKALEVKNDK